MSDSALLEHFSEHNGIDARSNDRKRPERFCRNLLNIEYLKNNTMGTRRGQKGFAPLSEGCRGIEVYTKIDPATEITSKELVMLAGVDAMKLFKLYEDGNAQKFVAIEYTGSEDFFSCRIEPRQNSLGKYTYHLVLKAGETEELIDFKDSGFGVSNPFTITQMIAAVNTLSDWNAAANNGAGAEPAAFILLSNIIQSGTDFYLYVGDIQEVYCPNGDALGGWDIFGSLGIGKHPSLLNHSNVLYVAVGKRATGVGSPLYKYDGVSFYAAGMPSTDSLQVTNTGTGLTGDYNWFITYEQDDEAGNIIEGDGSNLVSLTLSDEQGRLTIPTIQATTEYLTSFALANNGGTQSGTTLTVDDGSGGNHTLQVGQTAFFRDNAGDLQERKITARNGTSISIEGASVTIANNAVISANLKINLWRNKAGGAEFFLVRTFANDPSVSTFTYDDGNADDDLEDDYLEPDVGHAPPPAGLNFLTVYKGLLCGVTGGDDKVHFADAEGPEYFPTDFSNFLITSRSNDPVSGIGANREVLAIFKPTEVHVLTGDLVERQYRVELIAEGVGCDSHATIKEVDGTLWFWNKKKGLYRLIGTQIPDDLSYRVVPQIDQIALENSGFAPELALAALNIEDEQYYLYLPTVSEVEAESETTQQFPTDASAVFLADYRDHLDVDAEYDADGRVISQKPKVRWWPLDNMNMFGGATFYNGSLVWIETRLNPETNELEFFLSIQLPIEDPTNYVDHAQPIEWLIEPGWTGLGDTEVLKLWKGATIVSQPILNEVSNEMTVTLELDYKNGRKRSRKQISFNYKGAGDGWGGNWNNTPWGAPGNVLGLSKRFEFLPGIARVAKMVFSGEAFCAPINIAGWTIEAVVAYIPEIKDE